MKRNSLFLPWSLLNLLRHRAHPASGASAASGNPLTAIRRQYAERLYSFDEDAALIYGVVVGEATRAGRHLSMSDGMIAATAMRYNATLATRNAKDFAFLGLKVVNPWE